MGAYYFALCYSRKEFLRPHGLGVGAKYDEILQNDFRGALFALLENTQPAGVVLLDEVRGRWTGEQVAIDNDEHGGAVDLVDLRAEGWTDISPLVRAWIEQHRDFCIWFPDNEDLTDEPI